MDRHYRKLVGLNMHVFSRACSGRTLDSILVPLAARLQDVPGEDMAGSKGVAGAERLTRHYNPHPSRGTRSAWAGALQVLRSHYRGSSMAGPDESAPHPWNAQQAEPVQ